MSETMPTTTSDCSLARDYTGYLRGRHWLRGHQLMNMVRGLPVEGINWDVRIRRSRGAAYGSNSRRPCSLARYTVSTHPRPPPAAKIFRTSMPIGGWTI